MAIRLLKAWRKVFSSKLRHFSSLDQTDRYCSETGSKDESQNTEISSWRPSYLDQSVLVLFIALFMVLAISFEVLLYVSNENHGLASSYQGLHYLWTYGPTAVLTLIASFWARVEYQTKISAPWCRMLKGPATSQQCLLLDYVSQFQPLAIYAAVKKKDYPVAAAAAISLILRLIIVISTSFIVLSPTGVHKRDIEVILDSEFVDDPSGLSEHGAIGYSSLSALILSNTSLPGGISGNYAYQVAKTHINNTLELTIIVDGLFGDLRCEPATAFPVRTIKYSYNPTYQFTIGLLSNNCEMNIDCIWPPYAGNYSKTNMHYNSLCMSPGACNGSNSNYDRRIGIVASTATEANVTRIADTSNPNLSYGNFTIQRANSFICTPFYSIERVKTVYSYAGTQVSLVPNTTSRQLSSVPPWDIMQTNLDTVLGGPSVTWLSDLPVTFDPYSWFAFAFANYTHSNILLSQSSLFTGDNIVRLVSVYYRQYTAVLARVLLMKATSIPSLGSAIVSENRLLVQTNPTHLMATLLFISIIMLVIIWREQSRLLLPHKPNSIIGNAILLAHSPLSGLTGMGSAPISDLDAILSCWVYRLQIEPKETVQNQQLSLYTDQRFPLRKDTEMAQTKASTFRPLSLSATLRLLVIMLVGAATMILEILLHKSERNYGIANSPAEGNTYRLWTALPGLFSTLIGMYTTSLDSDVRAQSPLLRLSQGISFEKLSLNLVDRHTWTLMIEEVRSRSFEAFASTLAVAFTSFLTIFSASLFFAATTVAESKVQVKVSSLIYYGTFDSFLESVWGHQGFTNGILILLHNASYPPFTYDDLAFPGIDSINSTSLGYSTQSNVLLKLTVPAVRSDFSNCRLYNSSHISAHMVISDPSIRSLNINIHPEEGCRYSHTLYIYRNEPMPDHFYFGTTHTGCSTELWVWGSWIDDLLDDTDVRPHSIFALGCNDSLQVVDTSVVFSAQTMLVDTNSPPIPNYATAVTVASFYPGNPNQIYSDFPPISTVANNMDFDLFFSIITRSRYAIPVSYLGNASQASTVADAIRFHHRILVSQFLHSTSRYDNESQAQEAGVRGQMVPTWNKTTPLNGTIYDPTAHPRIFQDAASTRVLQSLFSITIACLGVNWFLMRNITVVPRSPTTIANWIALFADGNLNDFLPPNACQMPLSEISRWYFGQNAVFRLGFRESAVSGEKVLGIYVEKQDSAPGTPVERG
ncbi:hypothetical protein F4803DRAFT_527259 [Xylaria telfairii]|nr:hypothetical protein F4803DRAFT_527259 [Xylaria telfairii]